MNRDKAVAVIKPPITARASGIRVSVPGLKPSANGNRSRLVARKVINMARKRNDPAFDALSNPTNPFSDFNLFAQSTTNTPWETTMPVKKTRPMID